MDKLTLVIGNKAYSSWSLRPWLLMKHAGFAFDEIRIPLYFDDTREKMLRYSPTGRVPVLLDGNLTIWDSLAICEYLAEKHAERRFWPDDARARAHARSVCAEMHSGFGSLRNQMPMNVRRKIPGRGGTSEVMAEIERIQSMWGDCRARYGAQGPFLFGAFSIADAMYAPVVSRFHTYEVRLSGAVQEYADTMLRLPAMQEWISGAHAESEIVAHYEP